MDHSSIVEMCETLARKYKAPQHYDDLVSEGVLSCLEILSKEDNPHPAKLWRLANRTMHDYINIATQPMSVPKSDTARKLARGGAGITGTYSEAGLRHLERALQGEVVELDEFMVSVDDHADTYEQVEFEAYVMSVAVTSLNLTELYVLKERYFSEKTQEEIAQELGLHKMTVSRIEEDLLKKIKNNL